jgi:hypothetical protein
LLKFKFGSTEIVFAAESFRGVSRFARNGQTHLIAPKGLGIVAAWPDGSTQIGKRVSGES